jgi:hypothetical protein
MNLGLLLSQHLRDLLTHVESEVLKMNIRLRQNLWGIVHLSNI